ncbi:MAG: aminomethyltransferase family protein [Acidobacteria bacterium]|nr:aminomethyltransferase family protein [Acidobacteriota bacterium]
MPVGSAFHARTLPLAGSLSFRDWAGYYAVSAFEAHHEHEYNAIRNGCGLIDVSPLFKYHLHGPGAQALVDRVITRDASKMAVGQVYYTPWCDDDGKVIDDGTVARLGADRFRMTAADPNLRWLIEHAHGLDVAVEDVTEQVAALALQGPSSARLLAAVSDVPIGSLKYFRAAAGTIAGVPVEVTRTGYTGDLGYEVWMPWDQALIVWDTLVDAGRAHVLRPAGMLALDVARVEAGLLLTDVDFHSSRKASIAAQMYSPYELGLGRLVSLDKRSPFAGRAALAREHAAGHRREIVGLEVNWPEVEAIYQSVGLPPAVPAAASRVAVPVYRDKTQVGKATSTAWSPTLKKLIALATLDRPHFAPGSRLQIEITVEATRYTATATVVPTPFLKLDRRTATPQL